MDLSIIRLHVVLMNMRCISWFITGSGSSLLTQAILFRHIKIVAYFLGSS